MVGCRDPGAVANAGKDPMQIPHYVAAPSPAEACREVSLDALPVRVMNAYFVVLGTCRLHHLDPGCELR